MIYKIKENWFQIFIIFSIVAIIFLFYAKTTANIQTVSCTRKLMNCIGSLRMARIIDHEAGVVCYEYDGDALDCIPLKDTNLSDISR